MLYVKGYRRGARIELFRVPRGKAFVEWWEEQAEGDESQHDDDGSGDEQGTDEDDGEQQDIEMSDDSIRTTPDDHHSDAPAATHSELVITLSSGNDVTFRLENLDPDAIAAPSDGPADFHANDHIRLSLFTWFSREHALILASHIGTLGWRNFAWREFSYAILALAAGEFALLDCASFTQWTPESMSAYAVGRTNGTGGTQAGSGSASASSTPSELLLPAFATAIHRRGVEPGSSPVPHLSGENMYWLLDNLLVCLIDATPKRALKDDHDMLAAAVKFADSAAGRCRYRTHGGQFYVFLYMLTDVLIAKVSLPQFAAAVRGAAGDASAVAVIAMTSDWLRLLHDTLPTPYEAERYPAIADAVLNGSRDAHRTTFAVIMRVVDDVIAMNAAASAAAAAAAAAADKVVSSELGASGHLNRRRGLRLPYEIRVNIMDATDYVTYNVCARADTMLRRHALSSVRFDVAHIVRRLRPCMAVEHEGYGALHVLKVVNGSKVRIRCGNDDDGGDGYGSGCDCYGQACIETGRVDGSGSGRSRDGADTDAWYLT